MTPQNLIDTYVDDVVRQLPRKQRADVGTELRELLTEDLAAEAHATGRTPDEKMTLDFLNAFGRPEDVAMRYKPAGFNLIDPAYSRNFVRAAVIGVLVIAVLGLINAIKQHVQGGQPLSVVLPRWWMQQFFITLFWWPGFLLICTAIGSWARNRFRAKTAWCPPPTPNVRAGALIGTPLAIVWLTFLISPSYFLSLILPAGTDTSWAAYDPDFRHWRLAPLLILTFVSACIHWLVAIRGRWEPRTRWAEILVSAGVTAVMLWSVVAGPILAANPGVDGLVRSIFGIIVFFSVIGTGLKVYRNLGRTRLPARMMTTNGA